jgi:drug/metabolite transporter (DMT)-like permease
LNSAAPTVSRGIVAMLLSVFIFALMDMGLKRLAESYSPLQVACLRGLASLPFLLVWIPIQGSWRDLMPRRWGLHIVRGVLTILSLVLLIRSVQELTLGTAYGIFLSAPLLITALSAFFLKEQVGYHRWLAVCFGLIGVGIILNPDSGEFVSLGGLAALASALLYAIQVMLIQNLARTDSTMSMVCSTLVILAVGTGIFAYPDWIPIHQEHWLWIAFVGLTGAVGQFLIIYAFNCAPASVVAPFEYTAILWAIALDWLVWTTIPSQRMLAGALVVVVAGLYVIYREHWLGREDGPAISAVRQDFKP